MYKVVWIARYRKDLTKLQGSDYWTQRWGAVLKENVVIAQQLVGA
jgi:hypothetical protein